jgi:hypothetical protein
VGQVTCAQAIPCGFRAPVFLDLYLTCGLSVSLLPMFLLDSHEEVDCSLIRWYLDNLIVSYCNLLEEKVEGKVRDDE